jgi:hypothetical protein
MKNILVLITLACLTSLYANKNDSIISSSKMVSVSVTSSAESSSKHREFTEEEKEVITFIDINMDKLKAESASGKGETIDALSDMLKVKSDYLGKILQEKFDRIFYSDKVKASSVYYKILYFMKKKTN